MNYENTLVTKGKVTDQGLVVFHDVVEFVGYWIFMAHMVHKMFSKINQVRPRTPRTPRTPRFWC